MNWLLVRQQIYFSDLWESIWKKLSLLSDSESFEYFAKKKSSHKASYHINFNSFIKMNKLFS